MEMVRTPSLSILVFDIRWRNVVSFTVRPNLPPGERVTGIHWIRGWLNAKGAGLDVVKTIKSQTLPEVNTLLNY
jgi:hypothetical protein